MLTTRRTWLHRLFPWAFPRPAKRRRAAKPRSCRLELEHLEDRTLPTVLFNSALGGDTIFWVPNNSAGQPANQVQTGPISNNPSVLNSTTIYLDFWGTSWTKANAAPLASAAQTIIQSPFFSQLSDYGFHGTITYGGYTIDNTQTTDGNTGDPVDGQNTTLEIQNLLNGHLATDPSLPSPTTWQKPPDGRPQDSPIYIVVYDNGTGGANGVANYTNSLVMNSAYIGDNGNGRDLFTDLFSHEVAERISAGDGTGIEMNAATNANTDGEYQNSQISDNEPDGGNYTYRINGLQVQAYWSLTYKGFVVPDGNVETLYLNPNWQSSPQLQFTGNSGLVINGGQLANPNDNFILGETQAGGVNVNFNHEIFQFDPGQISNITVNPGPGNDLVKVNGPTSFNWPTLSITAAAAPTTILQVDSALAANYTITGGQMTIGPVGNTGSADTITYSQLAKLELNLAATTSPNTVDVESTPAEASTLIDDPAGSASVTVCQTSGNLDNIVSPLTVDGDGNLALIVNDQDNSNDILTIDTITKGTITRDAIDGFGQPHDASITYFGLGSLALNTGDLPNFVNVESTAVPTTVNAGAGNVVISVSPQAENLDNLVGDALTINGNGAEALIVTDQNNPNSNSKYTLSGNTLIETGKLGSNNQVTASITYNDVGSLVLDTDSLANNVIVQNTSTPTTINGGGGNNTYVIKATGAATVINTGSGNDSVDVGNSNLLDGIQAALTIAGQGGLDTLDINDQANNVNQSYFVSSSIIYVGQFSPGIIYTGIRAVELNGSQHASTYNIQSTAGSTAYTIDAGIQDDTFTVAPFIDNCDNTSTNLGLTLSGGGGKNTLEVYDQNNPNPGNYSVNAGVLYVRPLTLGITYSKISSLVLYGGQLGDTFSVYSTAGSTSYTLNGGSGGNAFNVGSFATNVLDNIQGAVTVNGEGNTSILNLNDQGNSGASTYTMTSSKLDRKGTAAITYSSLTVLVFNAGNNGNLITLSGTAAGTATTLDTGDGFNTVKLKSNTAAYAGPLTINGQAGVNTLSYAGFTGPVTVDLPLGVATGVAGGFSNIVNVIGGAGNDLLVGNGKGNILTGGSGRNILIAGANPGTLVGSLFNRGTLMVGGTTDYDTNLAALDAVMAEWASTDSYATRVNDLLNGGGQNGSTLLGATQFTNNGGGNTLEGRSPGQDLYYGIEALDANDWKPSLGEVFVQNPIQVSFQISGQKLTEPELLLDANIGVTTGANSNVGTYTVAPGTHTLSDPYAPNSSITFTVRADGTVTYSPQLAGILDGQGTNTLMVNGAKITLDGTHLSNPYLQLDTEYGNATATPFPVYILPGTHSVSEPLDSSTAVNFNVGLDGNVSYPQAPAGIFSGQGTSTLTVNGTKITIDSQLSAPYLQLDTYIENLSNTGAPLAMWTVTLLPGMHTLQQYAQSGTVVNFMVADNDAVSYDQSLDSILSGQGTSTLGVNGDTITVNATALSAPYLQIDTYIENNVTTVMPNNVTTTATPFSLVLLPGTHTLQELVEAGTQLSFTVSDSGTVGYDSSLQGVLSGAGTNTLNVNGDTITVNATTLSDPYLQIDSYIFANTAKSFSLVLLPGTHTLQEQFQAGTQVSFTVSDNGTVSYDSSLQGVLSGKGSSTLVVNGEPLFIDATAISSTVPTFTIGNIANLSTAQVQTLQVLPGTLSFNDGTLQFLVTLSGTDQLSYPTNVDSQVSGGGTNTLVILS